MMQIKNQFIPLAAVAFLGFAFPLGLSGQSGSIAGRVLLDGQIGLPNALVVYNRVTKLARDSKGSIVALEHPLSGSVRTAADGSFRIDSLPAGEYYLCALPVQPNQIKSCDSPNPPVVVQAATTLAGAVLNVRTGVLLSIIFDDPAGKITPRTLAVGWVSRSGAYSGATLAASSPLGSTFTVAIPKASTGNLFLDGSLTILDASGAPLPMRARSVPVTVTQETDLTISLRVQ